MFKPRQEEYTSQSGNKYMFQSVLPSVWARTLDRITDKNGKILNEYAIPSMLEQVVVEPAGLKMDDFEEWVEVEEVAQAALRFQQSRKPKDTDTKGR